MKAIRRKGLNRADLALWHAFTADIVPLFGRTRPEAPPNDPAPEALAPPPMPKAPKPAPQRALAPELRVNEQPGGLDRRRWKALRKASDAERTLDLHGRRANEAHAALRAFLHDAAADGVRTVTIITGGHGRLMTVKRSDDPCDPSRTRSSTSLCWRW
ncbi:Smr/MutS family protein [Leptolyngbya sp. 15MV]|nr:Smr/MutS family protein [Leptolyngbya sp. 15MV]